MRRQGVRRNLAKGLKILKQNVAEETRGAKKVTGCKISKRFKDTEAESA